MNKTSRSMIVAAAMTGLLAGTVITVTGCHSAGSESRSSMGAHSCAGMNSCKGLGGCKTGDNGCKGHNSCKGKGGCKVG